ncbi:hypothetical protein ARMGADRAFT_1087831 [Armillaria gallica]|uniref:Uncharacterized protein n=1 Tax=Armillaria gallica TaxID=47427 RepID=A0A2H3D7V8_ARMGA|nr:hypothetical protein ARMGADRAFT_1087831 [Armillaria gallica]
MQWFLVPCKARGGQEFLPHSLILQTQPMEPLVAPRTFLLCSNLQAADDEDDRACKDDWQWHGNPLRDEMGVDDEVGHPLNDVAGIDDIPDPTPPKIPQKHGLPPPGEVISHRHVKRKKKRQARYPTHDLDSKCAQSLRTSTAESSSLPSNIHLEALPAAYGGYAAKPWVKDGDDRREVGVRELLDCYGFQYIAWDGQSSRPIVDGEGMIFAVLAGHPQDPTYTAEADETWDFIHKQGEAEYWEPKYQGPH